ncbi:MAG: hypothetical protein R2909_09655 [Gemmatimonadales bacterium]
MRRARWRAWLAVAIVGVAGLGCTTLQQLAALRQVRFDLDGVRDARLAGVDLARIRSYSDFTPADLIKLTAAVARRDLPFEFTVDVGAENPGENTVTARMIRLQWALFLQDKETINGVVDQPVSLPPGSPAVIPVGMRLDLFQFFDGPAQSMFELARAALGDDADATTIRLTAVPTVDTPLGPIDYPSPITIARRTVR